MRHEDRLDLHPRSVSILLRRGTDLLVPSVPVVPLVLARTVDRRCFPGRAPRALFQLEAAAFTPPRGMADHTATLVPRIQERPHKHLLNNEVWPVRVVGSFFWGERRAVAHFRPRALQQLPHRLKHPEERQVEHFRNSGDSAAALLFPLLIAAINILAKEHPMEGLNHGVQVHVWDGLAHPQLLARLVGERDRPRRVRVRVEARLPHQPLPRAAAQLGAGRDPGAEGQLPLGELVPWRWCVLVDLVF
mmetsp:Transcript_27809/g.50276  ORF Transcript_27809/g.50276 Transcript_27809/m.50276 type:complete len:247 (-) Transcript_27809:861-1601(-)